MLEGLRRGFCRSCFFDTPVFLGFRTAPLTRHVDQRTASAAIAFNISPSLIQQAGGWKSEEEMAKYIAHIKAERVGGAQIAAMDAEDEDAPAAVVALTITGDASPATVQPRL